MGPDVEKKGRRECHWREHHLKNREIKTVTQPTEGQRPLPPESLARCVPGMPNTAYCTTIQTTTHFDNSLHFMHLSVTYQTLY